MGSITTRFRHVIRYFGDGLWLLVASVALALCITPYAGAMTPKEAAAIRLALKSGKHREAMKLLEPVVAQGERDAEMMMGLLCETHANDSCSPERVIELLKPAAEAGNAAAQYGLALALKRSSPPDPQASASWLDRAAKGGNAQAQFLLGQRELASAADRTSKRGLAWLEKAAEQGLVSAMLSLATAYEAGRGATQDVRLAAQWYTKAAELGHAVAQTRLASMYEAGKGLPRDIGLAQKWYSAAAEPGYVQAQYALGRMHMAAEISEPDYYEGIYWLEKAAEAGFSKAQDALGRAHYQGFGVRRNPEEALQWFLRAAEQGLPVAQHNAAALYEKERLLMNLTRAVHWYKKAANSGFGPSMLHIGDMYRYGEGVPKSLTVAQSWYARAADHDDPAIAKRGRKAMHSAIGDSVGVGIATFGAGERFPTAGELFDAIISAGLATKVLYPNAGGPIDPSLQASFDEIDRQQRAAMQQFNDATITGLSY